MAQLSELVQYLDTLLEPATYRDSSLNGLQIEAGHPSNPTKNVARVAFAVDAGETIVRRAAAEKASLLVVHHGLFWGKERPLTGPLGRKVALLMQHGISLYVSHLPLDGHLEVGNNVELARFFGLGALAPFHEYGGRTVGCRGEYTPARSRDSILLRARELVAGTPSAAEGLPHLLAFGPEVVHSVGVVSGSGSLALPEVAAAGLDLLISGEAKHEAYHTAQELGLNALFCGHYRTETFGVQALQRRLEKDFNVSTVFIEQDTGI